MKMFKTAVKVCRSASRSLLAAPQAPSRIALDSTLDKTLETIARVLCVQSRGVMVCGSASVSVAHFPSPAFSPPGNTL
ncbi:hypothetical protein [Pseudomonas sp. UBA1879]|uniref:hypothetical protein n=1 Tax=Pseudomonas sp. UBA1879 TaxID=1947305 RepID=UPI0025EC37C7|nr:hypothetical protein [Pseudomonas sp. UBA1879]